MVSATVSWPLLFLCVVSASGITTYTINLDLPPRERWFDIAKDMNETFAMLAEKDQKAFNLTDPNSDVRKKFDNATIDHLNTTLRKLWFTEIPKEITEEMEGFVEAMNHPGITMEYMLGMNAGYEAAHAVGCSGILATMQDGTVIHGRNLDWDKLKEPMANGKYKPTQSNIVFMRGGKRLFVATTLPFFFGIHTGMRFEGGWSFEQNTDFYNNAEDNAAAADRGGLLNGVWARQIMTEVPDFSTAVQRFATTKWAAPQYFILAGSAPWEGAVISAERLPEGGRKPFANVEVLDKHTRPALVQTNDDMWTAQSVQPGSRGFFAINGLYKMTDVNPDAVMGLMLSPPLFNPATFFTTVMVPAWDTFQTVDEEDAGDVDKAALFAGNCLLHSFVNGTLDITDTAVHIPAGGMPVSPIHGLPH